MESFMNIKDFFYELPEHMIARFPSERRDTSKLMVVDRKTESIFHYEFKDIIHLIGKDDFIVINNSRVLPVKLFGKIDQTSVEILIVKKINETIIEALTLPARKFKLGIKISFGNDLWAHVDEIVESRKGKSLCTFNIRYTYSVR